MNKIAPIVQVHKSERKLISLSLVFSILTLLATFTLGIAIGFFNPIYGIIIIGVIVIILILFLRLDEITLLLILSAHIWIDSYLGFYIIAMLIAIFLIFVRYFGQSTTHPWTRPRSLWLWILFLILTIYPAINGGSFKISDAESFYFNLILSAGIMFWLGNMIAKDISAVRRVFQLLSVLAVLIAIHTIIEAKTGIFLFASARATAILVQYSQFQIIGVGVSRSGSFFFGPDGNAAFLATGIFLPLGLFIESKQFWAKAIYLLEILLILQALIFTYSTGAWIAVIISMLAFVFLVGRVRYSMVILVLIAIIAVMALTIFSSQIELLLYHTNNHSSLSLHLAAWQTAVQVIKAFPLFGVGLGSQAYLVSANPYRVPAQIIPLQEPDNSYLQWGAMAGIPVMLVFILLLCCVFWFAWRNWLAIDSCYRPLIGGGIVALIALSICSLAVDGWTSPAGQAHFGWLIAGIVTSSSIGYRLHEQSSLRVNQDKDSPSPNLSISEQCKARVMR